jgi:dipeptidyl aminopeptidase/acylaminoacyl peptidase
VEDAVNGAKYLVSKGLADENRLCIAGGSAGGLTVLNALLHHDTFKAGLFQFEFVLLEVQSMIFIFLLLGASHYGVTDLEALVTDTHKFELRYLDSIVGPYPAAKDVYEERSPIRNKEKLKCPVIFFQGTEDHVRPFLSSFLRGRFLL